MTRTFPVFVLNVVMPFDEVDVNVHPTKTDVRFADSHKVFSCVYKAITSALAEQEQAILFGKSKSQNNAEQKENVENVEKTLIKPSLSENKLNIDNSSDKSIGVSEVVADSVFSDEENKYKDNYRDLIEKQKKVLEEMKYHRELPKSNAIAADGVKAFDVSAGRINNSNDSTQKVNHQNKKPSFSMESSLIELVESQLESEYKIVGQIFNTYLILESEGKVYFIDQHACHERFIYDGLLKEVNAGNVDIQDMLVPFVLECNNAQYEFFTSMIDNLRQLGFDIEDFGGLSLKVSSVPHILRDINLAMFFDNLFAEKQSVVNLKNSDLIRDKLAQKACKSAIKAGEKLDEKQIRQLLDSMKEGIPLQCPHGRPAVIVYTRKDFDKLFKRIL